MLSKDVNQHTFVWYPYTLNYEQKAKEMVKL